MNWLFLYITIVSLTAVNLKPLQLVDLSDSYLNEVQKIIEECQANPATRASDEWLKTEDLATADQYGGHILCRLTKVGSLKPNGDVDKDGMRRDISKGIADPKIVNLIVEKCGHRVPNKSPEQSAVENFRCVVSTVKSL
ncbi:uncharacterized protein LOC114333558 [Diabrotica virgifera virgifera]|uniref:Uncharacterized protein LOC114333558 n=1 Tax=Diabrotica virgifera virgifera TaxID=50390 RepID=A0A6P7G2H3_DIAVI|nr:uncharacterized protein LOC114333558 [Diabrotica virgifera virgifera]